MRVIGTAGHVDHGKSTLIAALTGIHPDRLKEEQERAMTIDLGFAWLTLPDGEEAGIVDVPGHRDFIENMLAGVGGIDAVLLVVAADEGIMPQTREHLAILDLLQIRAGLVVLTKIDLVQDPAWLQLVEADIRSVLRGTVLAESPILRVSSLTRSGFPELLGALSRLLKSEPLRPDLGRPRLPVDRVFSIAGFGTVVTGTLTDGRFKVGDEVEILPSGMHARIRGLQTHKKKETTASAGSRTAINLSGVEVDQIGRGDSITLPRQYRPTQRIDVRFRLLTDAAGPLRHANEVKLFLATSETMAAVRLLGSETLEPGQAAWLQLELRHPVVAVRGDRFILRRPSPGETIGGGTVVEPQPKARYKRFDEAVIQRLESLLRGSPGDILLQTSLALGPAPLREVVRRTRLEDQEAATALEELRASGELIALEAGELSSSADILVLARSLWTELQNQAIAEVETYHKNFPVRSGMPREELKSRLKLSPRVFPAALKLWCTEGILVEHGALLAIPGHETLFNPEQQRAVQRLLAQFAAAPFAPPGIKECQNEVGEEVYHALVERGELQAVSPEIVFLKSDYARMVEKISQSIRQNGQISLAEVRDQFKTSRRYAQALLEHLDAVGLTLRDGDVRRLKK
jgi:selenocysteine-specific elongation factor